MPSPVAHALGGFAAGWLVARPPLPSLGWGRIRAMPPQPDGSRAATTPRAPESPLISPAWRWPLAFMLTGMAADLDLLSGQHHAGTHSLGAALLVFLAALAILGVRRWRLAAAVGLAYASHILLDWLAEDSAPPIGIMALWPWSHDYFIAPVTVFRGISRQYWNPAAWVANLRSLSVELAIMVPATGVACWLRGVPGCPPSVDRKFRSPKTDSN